MSRHLHTDDGSVCEIATWNAKGLPHTWGPCFRQHGKYPDSPNSEALDADHVEALEREAVAAWLEDMADGHDGEYTWLMLRGRIAEADAQEAESDRLRDLAQQIRDGQHHANTPPNAQERGQDGLTGSATGVSDHDAIPVAQNAKYGLPKENK